MKRPASLRDVLPPDARVVCTAGFRPVMSREIERGSYFRLSDQVVKEHPSFFALCVPLDQLDQRG